jgi:hypothetical protein
MTPPTLIPSLVWSNQDLTLYHGTTDAQAGSVLSQVKVSLGRPLTDFGREFYTTTVLRQAHTWAIQMSRLKAGTMPAVIRLEVSRDGLAGLESLWFVLGDAGARDFWSLVAHCRGGGQAHLRKTNQGWYDAVIGPVTAAWQRQLMFAGADHISFHTSRAEKLLNRSRRWRVI